MENIDFNYFKEMYYKKIEERTSIRDRTNLPFSIFSTFSVIALIHFYNEVWTLEPSNLAKFARVLWFSYSFLIICFFITFILLVGRTVLRGLPAAKYIREQQINLRKYYSETNEKNPINKADEELEQNLIDIYVECIDTMSESNSKKIRLLHLSQYILYSSIFIVLLLALIIYII